MTEPVDRVVIVGSGLIGSLMAAMLARRGLSVDVYERRSDPRLAGAERGRSINLAISARGLAAMATVGLQERAMATSLPMYGRTMHDVDGGTVFQSYSADGTRAINSISRSGLNASLLDCAEAEGARVHFEHRLTGLDADAGELVLDTPTGRTTVTAPVILAADGAFSAARYVLQRRDGFNYRQDYLEHGYKELVIPPGPGGTHLLDPRSLHIWPRGSAMMIALPNLDGSFTCTLFWPKTGVGGLDSLTTPAQIRGWFGQHYPDVPAVMPTLVEDYQHNPVGSLVTVRCRPWVGGRVTLLGDAAHAVTPFYGQGANAGMEDCVELIRCLDETSDDWPRAVRLMQERRKPNADAIADYALANFVEMRDSVGSRVFRARTAAQHALERALPGYVSRYELVSFSTVPYADIADRLHRQNLVVAGAVGALGTVAYGVGRLVGRRRATGGEPGPDTSG